MKKEFVVLILLLVSILLISGCAEKECEIDADCLARTCFTVQCMDNKCVYSPVTNCCGNEICEAGETYPECAADCPNCDDANECTKDSYDYHERKCVNIIIPNIICCGNTICETGETYNNCAQDCPDCNDDNECTKDNYDYHEQKCVNELIIPCCGNDICDKDAETYSNCPTDCPNCNDGNRLTGDSFNYATQKCEYVTYYLFDDFDKGSASWDLESKDPRWAVVFPKDGTNGMLTNINDRAYTSFGDKNWADYTFNLKVKLEQGGAHIYVRRQPAGAYGVFITENHLKLWKDIKPAIDLEVKEYSFALNQFYDIKIEVKGNNIKGYVDNNLEISHTDKDNPLLWGNVGLEPMKKAYFDDIIVGASQ